MRCSPGTCSSGWGLRPFQSPRHSPPKWRFSFSGPSTAPGLFGCALRSSALLHSRDRLPASTQPDRHSSPSSLGFSWQLGTKALEWAFLAPESLGLNFLICKTGIIAAYPAAFLGSSSVLRSVSFPPLSWKYFFVRISFLTHINIFPL